MSTVALSAEPVRSPSRPAALGRGMIFIYGLIAYAGFLASITYAIGFLGNWIVPKGIDHGPASPIASAVAINVGLLALFAIQHTIMARHAFKRWWTTLIPPAAERSTFVIFSAALLGLLFWQWRPMPQLVWNIRDPLAAGTLVGLSLLGWALVFASSFMVSHADLFGLRQVWASFRGQAYQPIGFQLRGPYRLVRHPLMLGFLIAFWATPTLSVGHLLFAAVVTAYIRFGTWIEERGLLAEHGEAYANYRRSVRGLLPIPRRA